jgi:hypothetical protein
MGVTGGMVCHGGACGTLSMHLCVQSSECSACLQVCPVLTVASLADALCSAVIRSGCLWFKVEGVVIVLPLQLCETL